MWRVPRLGFSILRRAFYSGGDEMGKKGTFFYAVRKGFQPGVYNSWWATIILLSVVYILMMT